jgi:hypothetical protein
MELNMKKDKLEDLSKDKRCQEIHPKTGTQCGLPKGHTGQHQNGYITQPWSTR